MIWFFLLLTVITYSMVMKYVLKNIRHQDNIIEKNSNENERFAAAAAR
ncbi:hypothetical protein ACN6MY_16410 [Peribacillus sp. B-H-3]